MPKQHKRKLKPIGQIPGYSSEPDTASELGVSIYALRVWRQKRTGPPWVRVGRRIFYGNESRAAWLRGREIQPVREESAA